MRVGDFSACVMVDGNPLDEFDVVVDEQKLSATCYIPSQEGKKFRVQWKCWAENRPFNSRGVVEVDGLPNLMGKVMFPGRLGSGDTVERSGISVDAETIQDFVFSNVKLTDDEACLRTHGLEKLGEIKLRISRGTMTSLKGPIKYNERVEDSGPIHEKFNKAAVHRVGFEERKRSIQKPKEGFIKSQAIPEIYFIFRYRPLAILQAQGIAPWATPANERETSDATGANAKNVTEAHDNVPLQEPGPSDISSRMLDARIKALEDELAQLRALRNPAAARVKPEPTERPAKRPKHEHGRSTMPDVIELD